MSSFEYKSISPADFRVYEERARQLRAEAAQHGARTVISLVKSKLLDLAKLVHGNRHA